MQTFDMKWDGTIIAMQKQPDEELFGNLNTRQFENSDLRTTSPMTVQHDIVNDSAAGESSTSLTHKSLSKSLMQTLASFVCLESSVCGHNQARSVRVPDMLQFFGW